MMRFFAALIGLLFLAASAAGQVAPAPDDNPDNILLMKLRDGLVVIEMRPDLAPNHVRRIKELTRKGFYDGVPFHRVIPGMLAQTGDPTGTGAGGSGVKLKAEFSLEHHMRGIVSMARGDDPDSADSQFFIMLRPSQDLDRKYTIWGHVIRGMEFVNKIKAGNPEADGHVDGPDRIVSMKVESDTLKK